MGWIGFGLEKLANVEFCVIGAFLVSTVSDLQQ